MHGPLNVKFVCLYCIIMLNCRCNKSLNLLIHLFTHIFIHSVTPSLSSYTKVIFDKVTVPQIEEFPEFCGKMEFNAITPDNNVRIMTYLFDLSFTQPFNKDKATINGTICNTTTCLVEITCLMGVSEQAKPAYRMLPCIPQLLSEPSLLCCIQS